MSTDLIGSGQTYTSIALWWADIPATLVENEVGRVTNTAELTDTAGALLTGKTVGAFSITLEGNVSQSFADHANKLTNALRYNEANGAAWSHSTGTTMIESDQPITYRRLQLEKINDYGRMLWMTDAAVLSLFDQCIIEGGTLIDHLCDVRSTTFRNSLIIDRSTDAAKFAILFSNGGATENVTVVRTAASTQIGGISRYNGTVTATNTAIFGFFDADDDTIGGSNNASDLTIGFGSANQNSLSYASQFEVITAGSEDFRAKAGGGLLANGASAGMPTTDILGQTRDTSRDIGAHEQIAGGGGTDVGAKINAGLIRAGKLRGKVG